MPDWDPHTFLILLIVIVFHHLGEEVSLLRPQWLGHLEKIVDSLSSGQGILVEPSPKTTELASGPAYGDKKKATQSPVAEMSIKPRVRCIVLLVTLRKLKGRLNKL